MSSRSLPEFLAPDDIHDPPASAATTTASQATPTPPPEQQPTPEQQPQQQKMVEQQPVQNEKKAEAPKARPDARRPWAPASPVPAAVRTWASAAARRRRRLRPRRRRAAARSTVGTPARSRTAIADALPDNPRTRKASMSIIVRIWPDSTGRITKVRVWPARPAIRRSMPPSQNDVFTGLQLSDPPPADMPLPIVMRVSARRPQ